jgi:hypothetical protein
MPKRAKYITLATLGFFLITAVAYACPGNLLVANTSISTEMPGHEMAKHNDCGDPKVNPCRTVRDQIVSVKAAPDQATAGWQSLYERVQLLPQAVAAATVFHGRSPPTIASFHPVFKLPLSFSYLVLRL